MGVVARRSCEQSIDAFRFRNPVHPRYHDDTRIEPGINASMDVRVQCMRLPGVGPVHFSGCCTRRGQGDDAIAAGNADRTPVTLPSGGQRRGRFRRHQREHAEQQHEQHRAKETQVPAHQPGMPDGMDQQMNVDMHTVSACTLPSPFSLGIGDPSRDLGLFLTHRPVPEHAIDHQKDPGRDQPEVERREQTEPKIADDADADAQE